MGDWIHKMSEVDLDKRIGYCQNCGWVKVNHIGRCFIAYKKNKGLRRPYRANVGEKCVRCGYTPEHICQLDVDHIDGNHNNNSVDNLQTLCANCHRLKSYNERLNKKAL